MIKLSSYGRRGGVLLWIMNWFQNRMQGIGINGQFSQWWKVNSGVPQGSIFAPILLNLFNEDLGLGDISKVAMFADERKLFWVIKREKDFEEI